MSLAHVCCAFRRVDVWVEQHQLSRMTFGEQKILHLWVHNPRNWQTA